MFQHSVEVHSARYTEFLGDGDSKAHKLITEQAVYGDVEVTKLECVGHVQKSLGSRLWSLKKRLGQTCLEDGKTIGGAGRLTKTTIDKLQVYYGKAIRNNSHDLQAMKSAVMAIWHHTQSTNDHDLCPPGDDSWCGFQHDVAKGTSDYQHNHPLPKAVTNSILPIFEALSDEDLLARCLHGGTQNQNEAILEIKTLWQKIDFRNLTSICISQIRKQSHSKKRITIAFTRFTHFFQAFWRTLREPTSHQKTSLSITGWLLLKAGYHFGNTCQQNRQNTASKSGWPLIQKMAM